MAEKRCTLLLIGSLFVLYSCQAAAEVPLLINYRGYIDVSDPIIGLPTGALTVDLEFNLYSTLTIEGATPLWSETQTAQVLDGNFAVMLGSVHSLSHELFSSAQRYLTVSTGGILIAGPQQILSVPFAMQAGNVYSDSEGNVGIGTTSPDAELDVQGDITSESLTTGPVTANGLIYSTSGGFRFPDGTVMGTFPTIIRYSLDAADGEPEEALYVDNEGRVGIGTLTPSKELHVAGEAVVDATMTLGGWKLQPLPSNWQGAYMPYGGLGIGNSDLGSMLIISQGSEVDYSNMFLFGISQDGGQTWEFPLAIQKSGNVLIPQIQQEDWIAPTLENDWTDYGSVHTPAGYYKDSLGSVHLRGLVYRNALRAPSIVFTLPSGYRPEYQQLLSIVARSSTGGYTIGRVDIYTDGSVYFVSPHDNVSGSGAGNWICLDDLGFRSYQ